jgi:hypothetical protein
VFFFYFLKKNYYYYGFNQFCDVTKVAMVTQEDLAKFGYKLNMKVTCKEKHSIFLATYLKPWGTSSFESLVLTFCTLL